LQYLTPNNKHKKSGARRARQNKTPRSDAITLKGNTRVTVVSSAGSGAIDYQLLVTPAALGDRIAGISNYYERFRFNWLRFELRSKQPTTEAGTVITAVSDDCNNPVTAPTQAQLLDFRTVMEKHIYMDQVLKWSPVDRSKWYYCQSAAGEPSIDRFVYPCSYYVGGDSFGSSSAIGSLDLHYSITFEGACDTGLGFTVLSPPPPAESSPSMTPQKSILSRIGSASQSSSTRK
jgi:hypothetical protein